MLPRVLSTVSAGVAARATARCMAPAAAAVTTAAWAVPQATGCRHGGCSAAACACACHTSACRRAASTVSAAPVVPPAPTPATAPAGGAAAAPPPLLPSTTAAAAAAAAPAVPGVATPIPGGNGETYINNPDPGYKALIDEIIRVDHAGEIAAVRIYEGQAFVLRSVSPAVRAELKRMREGEVEHMETLARMMADRRVRPTVFEPLVHVAGFALGAATAVLGKEAAMACTVAVETVIGDHYNDQIRTLLARGYGYRETELAAILKKHRDDELDHLDTGLRHGAESAPAYNALVGTIKAGCTAAIWLAKRF